MRRFVALVAVTGLACWSTDAGQAYWLDGHRWASGNIQMDLHMGTSGGRLDDGSADWDEVMMAALSAWNQSVGGLSLRGVRNTNPVITTNNGINDVFWHTDVYGEPFGDAVAVTVSRYVSNTFVETDVVFDQRLSWNSYRGNLDLAENGTILYDMRRVALHEFGHAIGLGHPDAQGQFVTAIMNSAVSNIDSLQADDIAGGRELYGNGGSTPPPTSTGGPDRLRVDARLRAGNALISANDRYRLLYQADGNLVLLDDYTRTTLWSANTSGAPGYVTVQADGNAVIVNAQGRAVWATGTSGSGAYLVMQNDGNLVLYRSDGVPLWDRVRGAQGGQGGPGSGGGTPLSNGTFRGTIGSTGSTQFGGPPYCYYAINLSNVTATIVFDGSIVPAQGQVTALATETGLNGCPYAPIPPNQHLYTMMGGAINGGNLTMEFAAAGSNAPRASLVFHGSTAADGRSISGTLTWHRTDLQAPFDWTIVSNVTLRAQ